ncbi:clostripain-related cysteine peptidase [Methanochimaera problematica]|uniref:clostripain-related cysteine peptidase n=1 Tax=Methanochimaera problematica TaxID=2609417 RepID=UPI0029390CB9|nr:clostripain-related cysteine peptidase [Methanoplanus sp. FWC-SCC4]
MNNDNINLFSDNPLEKSTLIAVYMVGSDLESEHKAGTYDLNTMIEGYGDSDPEKFNVIVGYGGANVTGWEGISIATMSQLKEDSQDGIFGNENFYTERDSGASMGDEKTLEKFLDYIMLQKGYDQKYLIFWDHGNGYNGYGFDEIYEDELNFSEIKQAMINSESSFNIVGFDACLMGMIEVACVFESHADYLIASEELEPGSGWMYDLLFDYQAKNPKTSPEGFGKVAVDTYMKSEDDKKTLSIVNLKETDNLISNLDCLSDKLKNEIVAGNFEKVGQPYRYAEKFGYFPQEEEQTSVDLYDFISGIKARVPSASDECDLVLAGINSFVLYSAHDDFFDNARGVSICSPRYIDSQKLSSIEDNIKISDEWYDFFENYVEIKSSDNVKPEVTYNEDDTFTVSDNLGVAEVKAEYFIESDSESLPVGDKYIIPDTNGRYYISVWDGKLYYLENENGDYANLYLEHIGNAAEGFEKYQSSIEVTRGESTESAMITVIANPKTHETMMSVDPYEPDSELFKRSAFWDTDDLKSGDVVKTYTYVYDEESDDYLEVLLGTLTVDETTRISYGKIPGITYSFGISAEDFNGNLEYSDLVILNADSN